MNVSQLQSADTPLPKTSQFTPYPPSFVDRILHWFTRLPIPYGLTYLALFVLQSLLFHILGWIDGWLPVFTFNSINLVFPLWLWGCLAIMTYLNSTARNALAAFSPLLPITPDEYRQLDYEFTTIPPRAMLLSAGFWSIVYALTIYTTYNAMFVPMGMSSLLAGVVIFEGFISYLVGSAIYYHSFRLLILVYRTVNKVEKFDLFHLDPVYAFSVLTARIGAAWIILISLNLLFFPMKMAPAPVISLLVIQLIIAVAAFVLPLQSINRKLVAEKRRLLGENTARIELVLAQLHQKLDSNQLGEMAQLSTTLTGLNNANNYLSQIPTWPWRTELLSRFVSVALLPIILFIIQALLRNWLGL